MLKSSFFGVKTSFIAQKYGAWVLFICLIGLNACGSKDISAADGGAGDSTTAGGNPDAFLAFDTLRAIGASKRGMCSYKLTVPEIKIDEKQSGAALLRINETFRKYIAERRMSPAGLDSCETEYAATPGKAMALDAQFEVYRNDAKIFGVAAFGYDFFGGAHPTPWGKDYAFDLKTGENLKATAVFKDGFLSRLNEKLKEKLKPYQDKQYLSSPLSEYKGKEKADDLRFQLYADSVVVLYDSDEITPYAVPPPRISFTTKEIKELLRPEVFEKGWVKKD